MELTPERKRGIRERLEPLLAGFDPGLKFVEVILDSERRNLGVIVQKDDQPAVLRFDFVRYVSMPEAELRTSLEEQLRNRRMLGNSRS
ncbi:MAG: hypothetical protein L0212_01510 [Acidobacteria bacterium]|nr:hypothetical protein [Acidobacteriota bacterium]